MACGDAWIGTVATSTLMSSSDQVIAQANPGAGYTACRQAINDAVERVLASGTYILGQEVSAFEDEFAAFLGTGHALGCANGTDALVLALKALGIGRGDTVATVSHTAVATVAAIEIVGAAPLLLDIEEDTYTMDPAELDAVLSTPRPGIPPIKAVIPVHVYGQPAALDAICRLAKRHGVAVIEDCAQAHGAEFEGRGVGSWGDAAAFSFYPTKNLGAFGDAGGVATDDAALADRVRALRQYGWDRDRVSGCAGINSRLDELQAAILRIKLPRLRDENARRQTIADAYDLALTDARTAAPVRRPDRTHVFHQYVVRRRDRDAFRRGLLAAGIGSAVHYPVPVHLQPAYAGRVELGPRRCRTTEVVSEEVVSLPMHPGLLDHEVERVCRALAQL